MPAERAPYGGGQGGEGGEEAAGGGADAGRQGQDGRPAAVKQRGQGRQEIYTLRRPAAPCIASTI